MRPPSASGSWLSLVAAPCVHRKHFFTIAASCGMCFLKTLRQISIKINFTLQQFRKVTGWARTDNECMDVKGLAAVVALWVCGESWVCPVRRVEAADGFTHARDKMISKGPYTRLLCGSESVRGQLGLVSAALSAAVGMVVVKSRGLL